MPTLKRKVVTYITSGNALLVFRHPDFPEAGIQVPAGTIEEGEAPEAAALREAFEETGLTGLTLVAPLGEHVRDVTPLGRTSCTTATFPSALHRGGATDLASLGGIPLRWQRACRL